MSNYDYRPELEELYVAEEEALRKQEELIEEELKIRKAKEEEEANDSNGNDRKTPVC